MNLTTGLETTSRTIYRIQIWIPNMQQWAEYPGEEYWYDPERACDALEDEEDRQIAMYGGVEFPLRIVEVHEITERRLWKGK